MAKKMKAAKEMESNLKITAFFAPAKIMMPRSKSEKRVRKEGMPSTSRIREEVVIDITASPVKTEYAVITEDRVVFASSTKKKIWVACDKCHNKYASIDLLKFHVEKDHDHVIYLILYY